MDFENLAEIPASPCKHQWLKNLITSLDSLIIPFYFNFLILFSVINKQWRTISWYLWLSEILNGDRFSWCHLESEGEQLWGTSGESQECLLRDNHKMPYKLGLQCFIFSSLGVGKWDVLVCSLTICFILRKPNKNNLHFQSNQIYQLLAHMIVLHFPKRVTGVPHLQWILYCF